MSPVECRVLFFDLDGTLVDSALDIATAVNKTLAELKMPAASENQVRSWIGNGISRLVERALWQEFDAPTTHPEFDRALALCRHYYADGLHDRSECYQGVRECLSILKARGFMLACITNKPEVLSKELLAYLQLEGFFSLLLGGDSLPMKKPDPQPLLHASRYFAEDINRCVMIGDSINDIKAANAAGCASICVSYGYNQGLDPISFEPTIIIDQFSSILDHIVYKS